MDWNIVSKSFRIPSCGLEYSLLKFPDSFMWTGISSPKVSGFLHVDWSIVFMCACMCIYLQACLLECVHVCLLHVSANSCPFFLMSRSVPNMLVYMTGFLPAPERCITDRYLADITDRETNAYIPHFCSRLIFFFVHQER